MKHSDDDVVAVETPQQPNEAGDDTPAEGIPRDARAAAAAEDSTAAEPAAIRVIEPPTIVEGDDPGAWHAEEPAPVTAAAAASADGEPKQSRRAARHERRAAAVDARGDERIWGTREIVQAVSTIVVVLGVTIFTFAQLHPSKIFSAAVPTGGDMGAHVWAPAYLRDHLLPNGKVIGWSMDWYAGLPVYRFYMLPPALLILALDTVIPYGMAFKIVAVLGILTLPVACWAFGRLGRFAFPIPAMFAIAGTIFLFDETFTILGGNIASTMAGEFSFSIALTFAMLALGVFARGMENGRHRPAAAVLIALAALTHGIVVFFVAVGVVLLWLVNADRHRTVYFITTSVTAVALSAFWLVPFVLTSRFMTDMKYEGAPTPGGQWNSYWRMFFPHTTLVDQLWVLFALIGFIAALARRHRVGTFLGIYQLVLVVLVVASKSGIPGFGLLWNVRLLPFLYLLRYMLAMVGIVELVWFVLRALRNARLARLVETAGPELPTGAVMVRGVRPRDLARRTLVSSVVVLGVTALVSVGWMSWHLGKFPGQTEVFDPNAETESEKYRFEFAGIDVSSSVGNGFVDGWAQWNFSGWVGKPAYGEYRALMDTMRTIGADPEHGCGRAAWEEPNGGEYGTPMALMLLPFWTDSCIGSLEGLYFEASATTPYNFLTRAAMSQESSNPVRGLTYENQDAELGVHYLQTLGVRYFMAWTPEAVARAQEQPELIEIAVSGPWHVFEVAGSDLVVPVDHEPVVVRERPGDQRERWLEVGASWLQHPEIWNAVPVADGPPEWQRVDVAPDELLDHPKLDLVRPTAPIEARPLGPVEVSDVRLGNESVSFRVDEVGVPVIVRVSYFPNWEVSGAEGPYRVAPNMMLVIPTEQEVRLTYALTWIDWMSYGISVLGVIGLFVLWRRGPVVYPDRTRPWAAYPLGPDPFGDDPAEPIAPTAPPVDPDESFGFGEETFSYEQLLAASAGAASTGAHRVEGSGADVDVEASGPSTQAMEADAIAAWAGGDTEADADDAAPPAADRPVPIDPTSGWAVPMGERFERPPGSEFWAAELRDDSGEISDSAADNAERDQR